MRAISCAVALFLLTVPSVPADEKKAPPPPTAWGRPVGKLQLGLRPVAPGKDFSSDPKAVTEVAVVLRNLGKTDVPIHRPWLPWRVSGVEHNGVVTSQPVRNSGGYGGTPGPSTLKAGGEEVIAVWPVHRPLSFGQDNLDVIVPHTRLRPGTYQFGVEHFEIGVGGGLTAGATVELGTGYLDVVVPKEK